MAITVTNRVRKIIYDHKQLEKDADILLAELGYADFDLGILLTNNKTIRQYNKQYRAKDKATDVLSFACHPDLKPGERITPETEDDKNLGDIIISLEYVSLDAPNWQQAFEERMRVLLVHGICHLLGYDHEFDDDYAVMNTQEERLLSMLRSVS